MPEKPIETTNAPMSLAVMRVGYVLTKLKCFRTSSSHVLQLGSTVPQVPLKTLSSAYDFIIDQRTDSNWFTNIGFFMWTKQTLSVKCFYCHLGILFHKSIRK